MRHAVFEYKAPIEVPPYIEIALDSSKVPVMTQDCKSVLYEAAAGSGKTTLLVKQALSNPSKRVLFTTFTNENTEVIGNSLLRANGLYPQHIDLMPWFTFLLRHCVRPFLWHAGFCLDFDSGLILVNEQSARGTKKNSIEHYVSSDGRVYSDKLAELALRINGKTQGAVIDRLASIYDCLFIDEAQDLSGYDLELIEVMLRSGMNLTLAADQRQATYHTNNSAKNKRYRDLGLGAFLRDNKLTNLCIIDDQSLAGCHRCNQQILNLANALYPDLTAAQGGKRGKRERRRAPPTAYSPGYRSGTIHRTLAACSSEKRGSDPCSRGLPTPEFRSIQRPNV